MIIVLAALLLIPICGFAALAIDYGFLATERAMLRSTADAAALACASALPGDAATAQQRGLEYIDKNPAYGTAPREQQIRLGIWDRGRFLPRFDDNADACQVIVGMDNKLFFAPVIGIPTARVIGKATASRYPGDANISLVFDNSGSMFFDIGRLRAAATAFLDRLSASPGVHAVSLTTFDETAINRIKMTQNLNDVRNQLKQMQPGGWTNIGGGLFHGRYDSWGAGSNPVKNARNITILLSDGATNRGRGGEPGQDCAVSEAEEPNIEAASRRVAVCEAQQFKNGDPGGVKDECDANGMPKNANGNMLIAISLGNDLDLPLMQEMSSACGCRAAGGVRKDCAPGDPNCCHYRAPSSNNLDAIFKEILYNGPVNLVE